VSSARVVLVTGQSTPPGRHWPRGVTSSNTSSRDLEVLEDPTRTTSTTASTTVAGPYGIESAQRRECGTETARATSLRVVTWWGDVTGVAS
jgi:hypothetical protein